MDKKRPATIDWSTANLRRRDAPSPFPLTHTHITPGAGFRPRNLNKDAVTVGWICALEAELAASVAILDEEFRNLPEIPGDSNTYTLGRIGDHNIVMVCLPAGTTGTNAAAMTATNMMRSFPRIRFGLMVGIGGGAPGEPCNDPRQDIRLGDVVVSCPTVDSSGVLQYDFGKMREGRFVTTGTLNKTHVALRNGISVLRARHRTEISQIRFHIDAMLRSNRQMRGCFDHPGLEHDQLFRADYEHIDGESSCETCDRGSLLVRKPREDKDPVIHYGLIGSANQVMKHGITREKLRKEKGILCFEMEAAGLMDILPCLVIRGICDYADSHKNKRWQPYAAAAAAAYAKEILSVIPPAEVPPIFPMNIDTIHNMLQSFISESSLDQLLQYLPATGQSQRESAIPDLDTRDSKFSWVFKNIDYQSWRSNDSRFVLCLSSPQAHQLSQVTSFIVDQEQKANRPVLYYFCSQITNSKSNKGGQNAFIYTLLKQIILLSPIENRLLIIRNLLSALLQKIFDRNTSQNWTQNDLDGNDLLEDLRDLLDNPATEDLLAVFQLTLDYAKLQPTLIVLDGIEKAYQGGQLLHLIGVLINDLRRQSPNIKALLAGPTIFDITALSQDSVFMEYDKERKECLSSLQFENTRYEKITPEQSGSFEWIWAHDEYKRWSYSETSRLLYIEGKPGSGKSTLTKYFYSHLPTSEPAAKKAIVAKFFYSFREGELQRSHYSMLLSLLYDIVYQDEAFFYHQCQSEYRAHQHYGPYMKWGYESLKKVLKSLQDYSAAKRFYLVIDAVDESEEVDRHDILSLLHDLCSKTRNCVVKIFIASRPVPQIKARRDEFLNFIRLQDETITDIFNFAHSLLDGIHLDPTHILPQAIEYIVDNAQGVFLWVKLVGAELIRSHEDGLSQEDILALLRELPTELKDVYDRMLDKMKGSRLCLSHGLKMFRFILFAKRPLTVDELLHCLSIPDDLESDGVFDFSDEDLQKHIPSSERIILASGGHFLEIKLHEGKRIVQVIHQTANEFLLDPHRAVAESEFRIDRGYAHILIAITCIRYLMVCATNTSQPDIPPGSEHWIPKDYAYYAKYLDKRPLITYAFCHLKDHIDAYWGYANQNAGIRHLAAQIPNGWVDDPFKILTEKWTGVCMKPDDLREIRNGILLAAASGGFLVATEAMISAMMDLDLEHNDYAGWTALSWASWNGYEAIVRLLLRNNARSNTQDIYNRTPLMWAAGSGHNPIMKLLLQSGASIDTADHYYRTALSYAAEHGHQAAVKLLLLNDASIDTGGILQRTALSFAAGNGHQAIVELLLRNNALTFPADSYHRTALSYAAENGHQTTVEVLLQNGASVDAIDSYHRTALSYAAGNGHQAIVQLLLQNDAFINSTGTSSNIGSSDRSQGGHQDTTHWTPLIWAARSGHQAIVELLLQNGAYVDTTDISYDMTLSYAAENGYQGIVDLLLPYRAV